jgi:hypothetical protein
VGGQFPLNGVSLESIQAFSSTSTERLSMKKPNFYPLNFLKNCINPHLQVKKIFLFLGY